VTSVHLHLVSDSTGETVSHVAKAALVQFDEITFEEHLWSMVRSERQVDEVIEAVGDNPGFVLYTLVNEKLQQRLEGGCRELQVPSVSVLRPVVDSLRTHLGRETHARPGRQHMLDAEYFDRIAAMDFVLGHDDGQSTASLDDADVILVGVSRTSKTPTSIYLGHRGIRTANIPIVPGARLPDVLFELDEPLIVGLTASPERIIQIRRNRLINLKEDRDTGYIDEDAVREEVVYAKRLFSRQDWPVIDVTRRSIEETAAKVINLLNEHRGEA